MKATLLQDGPERTCALVFDAGEDVVAALLRFASDEKLRGAHLTATGTFQRVTLGVFDPTRRNTNRYRFWSQSRRCRSWPISDATMRERQSDPRRLVPVSDAPPWTLGVTHAPPKNDSTR